ncbi:zinc-binding alcohol dehydrogenase family protein [Helcobacillus massiliensis]|uniref:Zinc-type alcohol dehydrogenase-like protein n=1 Tax=Helcobacillus massiliensis TaxID=521392 RepID=A0A839R1T0_9MICO|nr:zinc-binding alcohol dehydrogenase family protein [Helcobacillus massiliensis]MBB3024007.1 zinc-binding alcohol dehydrogenase family protein [Helcobacillus massiliensis]
MTSMTVLHGESFLSHRAIGCTDNLPVEDDAALVEQDMPTADPVGRDLLVEVRAVSVNPIDVKQRRSAPTDGFRVLGFDAAGVVRAVGGDARRFEVGDEVMYAGQLNRDGSNQELQLVDERIVGRAPKDLSWAERAALPLTSLTAFEALTDSLGLTEESEGTILVNGATGGVGTAMLQLLEALFPTVTVIATASSAEKADLVRSLGAEHTVDHTGDLAEQVLQVAPGGVDWMFTSKSGGRGSVFADLMKPRGHIVAIDEIEDVTDLMALKSKAITWHWESMFVRPLFQTDQEITRQHEILEQVADLADEGRIRPVMEDVLRPISAQTLREAHRRVESGRTVGKIALEGWERDE